MPSYLQKGIAAAVTSLFEAEPNPQNLVKPFPPWLRSANTTQLLTIMWKDCTIITSLHKLSSPEHNYNYNYNIHQRHLTKHVHQFPKSNNSKHHLVLPDYVMVTPYTREARPDTSRSCCSPASIPAFLQRRLPIYMSWMTFVCLQEAKRTGMLRFAS